MKDLKDKLIFPLIIVEGLDIILYNSIEALETDLEGIDVAENRYKSFDAEGRSVILEAIGAKRRGFLVTVGRVRVAGAEDIPSHKQELTELLLQYLKVVGESVDDKTELKDLVRTCARRQMEGK